MIPKKPKRFWKRPAGWTPTATACARKTASIWCSKYGTTNREVRQDTQAVAQQDLAEIGIKLDLQSFDSDIFFATYAEDGPSANFSLDMIEYSDSPDSPIPNTVVWRCVGNPIG